ncbi:hypothetical protein CTAYLR_008453 [Chrysophaeum taylorii]|uniref:Auxin efflux carrier n=1 Tax=Chrysophaeum taylorii TaxID=2483200 RepID=A0AAD7XMR5_9STRA|nr:hypothetical protein CTAYLR_008453 [Chrysophaeum taylorii]
MEKTLFVALRSVGTTGVLALGGWYLRRKGIMSPHVSKGLSKISMTLTIPCLLFTTATSCAQNDSGKACPALTHSLRKGWPILLLPAVYVGAGLLVGRLAAILGRAGDDFRRTAQAAVAFGNSTGLPITLLTAIASQKALNTDDDDDDGDDDDGSSSSLGTTNPLLFLSVYLVLYPILQWSVGGWLLSPREQLPNRESSVSHVLSEPEEAIETSTAQNLLVPKKNQVDWGRVAERVFPPPVVGAIAGMVVALIQPLRGVLVDIKDRDDDAPLEWIYNGVVDVGAAAVPLNMFILGNTLSKRNEHADVSPRTRLCVATGKLVVMPMVGVLVAISLRALGFRDPAVLLVSMVVTSTPTANNLIVMAELAGENKEALAATIFVQYAIAPITLTFWITVFLVVANGN